MNEWCGRKTESWLSDLSNYSPMVAEVWWRAYVGRWGSWRLLLAISLPPHSAHNVFQQHEGWDETGERGDPRTSPGLLPTILDSRWGEAPAQWFSSPVFLLETCLQYAARTMTVAEFTFALLVFHRAVCKSAFHNYIECKISLTWHWSIFYHLQSVYTISCDLLWTIAGRVH